MQAESTESEHTGQDDGARWRACTNCARLEHPNLTCDEADRLIRERVFQTHHEIILAASRMQRRPGSSGPTATASTAPRLLPWSCACGARLLDLAWPAG